MEATIGLREIADEMRKGIQICNHKHLKILHKNCFIGKDAVDWLVKERHARTRKEGERLCQRMARHGLFHAVSSVPRTKKTFRDAHLFYRFYCDEGPASSLGMYWGGRSHEEEVAPPLHSPRSGVGLEAAWTFAPHTAHNSLVLDLRLATGLQGQGETQAAAVQRLRNRVRRALKEHDKYWQLEERSEGPCGAPVYQFSRKRRRGAYQTQKTVGTIPASPSKFQTDMLGMDTRKLWEPLVKDYRVVQGGLLHECTAGLDSSQDSQLPSTPGSSASFLRKSNGAPQTPSYSEFSFEFADEEGQYQIEQMHQMARANLSDPMLLQTIEHLKQTMMESCPSECMRCGVGFSSAEEARCCECCAVVACAPCCQKKVYEINQKKVVKVCRHCYEKSSRICHPSLMHFESSRSMRSSASLSCLKGIPQVQSLVNLCELEGGESARMLYHGQNLLSAFQSSTKQEDGSELNQSMYGNSETEEWARSDSADSAMNNSTFTGDSEISSITEGLHIETENVVKNAQNIQDPPLMGSLHSLPYKPAHCKYCNVEVEADDRAVVQHSRVCEQMRKALCQQLTPEKGEKRLSNIEELDTRTPRIAYRTISSASSRFWPREVCFFQDSFEDEKGSTFVYEISVQHQNERGQAEHITAEVLLLAYMASPDNRSSKVQQKKSSPFQDQTDGNTDEKAILTVLSQVDYRTASPEWAMIKSYQEGLGIYNFPLNQEKPNHELSLAPRGRTDTFFEGKASLESFELLAVLGRGGFGKVLQVKHKDSQMIFAMKIIKKSDLRRKKQVERMNTERTILAAVDHPFIVKLQYAFQTRDKLYMVMDFVQGGDLFYLLRQKGQPTLASKGRSGLGEEWTRLYMAEIALALQHLHDQGIVYRDLKPENVLVERDGHIKLTDFGLSRYLERSLRRRRDLSNEEAVPCAERSDSVCGTEQYMAPEMLLQQGHGPAVDWWCLGVLAHEMASRKHPFKCSSHYETLQAIATKPPSLDPRLSSPFLDLLSKLLVKDQTRRLCCSKLNAFSELQDHAFFEGLDWNAVLAKEIIPPYRPNLRGPMDVSHFETVFTKESVYSQASAEGLSLASPFPFALAGFGKQRPPAESFDAAPEELVLFKGFSYVAPENKQSAPSSRNDNRMEQTALNVEEAVPERKKDSQQNDDAKNYTVKSQIVNNVSREEGTLDTIS